MYEVKAEPTFKEDYKRIMRKYPYLKRELHAAVSELIENGCVSPQYNPHILNNAGGNYNGYIDFHLSDGEVDVIVLYLPHKTNPIIRLVRMGGHEELFHGALL